MPPYGRRQHEHRGFVRTVVDINGMFPMAMIVAGFVLMIAAAISCDLEELDSSSQESCAGDGEVAAIILSLVNMVLAMIYVSCVFRENVSENTDLVFCLILFALWVTTAGLLTFDAPFVIASNGWVASWGGVVASLGNLVHCSKYSDSIQGSFNSDQSFPIMLVIGGGILVIVSAFSGQCCVDDEIIAIVAGVIGVVVGFIRILMGPGNDKIVGGFLTLVWLSLGLYLTFTFFVLVNNGFLGCWISILASCYIFLKARK